MLGETEQVVDDGTTKITKSMPNPGFWSRSDNFEIDVDSLPPLRILVCGYPGVGKSNLVSKVFGVDLVRLSLSRWEGLADSRLRESSQNVEAAFTTYMKRSGSRAGTTSYSMIPKGLKVEG